MTFLVRLGLCLLGLLGLLVPQLLWRTSSPTGQASRLEQICEVVTTVPRQTGAPRVFVDVTEEVGLDFRHVVGPLGTYFMPEVNGAGGALWDYDDDGDLDLLLINSGRSPKAVGDFPAGTRSENRLFRQESDGRFTDVTQSAGVASEGFGVGCAVGDVDNDGDLDLYVTNYGPDRLLENQGDGTFVDITEACGIRNSEWASGAVFFDYDRDGWLDLFVVNYTADPLYGHTVACDYGEGNFTYCGPLKFRPTADRLFHNEGRPAGAADGSTVVFRDATDEAGLGEVTGAGFTVVSADFNRDGWPDLYVANDMYPNRLWINRADGTFYEQGLLRGAAVNVDGMAEGSMGVALGDVNGDGWQDLLATHFTRETNTLYVSDGDGNFVDNTQTARLGEATYPHTGWGVALLDLDHDGDLDLPLVNGLVTPCRLNKPTDAMQTMQVRQDVVVDEQAFWRDYVDRNLVFVNDGSGRFDHVSELAGDFTSKLGSGRAMLYGDLDNDGDLDLIVTYCAGRTRVFRNDVPKLGHWLMVRAVDPRLKRDAYGAEVVVVAGDRRFHRVVSPAGSYLASNDVRVHFGLGGAARYDEIRVHWPDGAVERFPAGDADRRLVLNRGQGLAVEATP